MPQVLHSEPTTLLSITKRLSSRTGSAVSASTLHFGMLKTEEPASAVLEATVRQAEAGKAEAINQVRTGVEVAWLRTQNAINQYKLSASTVKLASENLKLKSKSFDEGLATALDVNEARNQLFAAEVGRRVAAFEFVSNYAMPHAIAGQMSEFMNAVNKHEVIVEN